MIMVEPNVDLQVGQGRRSRVREGTSSYTVIPAGLLRSDIHSLHHTPTSEHSASHDE